MPIPPADGPRALLKAQLAQLAGTQRTSWLNCSSRSRPEILLGARRQCVVDSARSRSSFPSLGNRGTSRA